MPRDAKLDLRNSNTAVAEPTSTTNTERLSGKVKWFDDDKGYGFIITDGTGQEVFAHYKNICRRKGENGRRTLLDDERVSFEVVVEDKGPKAINIQRVD